MSYDLHLNPHSFCKEETLQVYVDLIRFPKVTKPTLLQSLHSDVFLLVPASLKFVVRSHLKDNEIPQNRVEKKKSAHSKN